MTRLTVAEALVRFLAAQHVERDGRESRFIEGCFGIFGHGNVAGVGDALRRNPDLLRYHQARNEQAMVHTAVAYSRTRNRLATLACTTSVGPGATNLVTGAATATINRLPVLLLPGDVFATHRADPVLQQLEVPARGDVSVNDCLIPVSRYFDRVSRPEQLMPAMLAAMRVLTDPAECGAVTLALPEDVQAEAVDVPDQLLARRVWHIGRTLPDDSALERAVRAIRNARRPLIVAGGGVLYSEASEALQRLVESCAIPVAETQAGKGAVPSAHPLCAGAIGATGGSAANRLAADADLVIGVGTRWSDFTTASRTAFQDPGVRFVNVNVARIDALKHGGIDLVGDARATLVALAERLQGYRVDADRDRAARAWIAEWRAEIERVVAPTGATPLTQAEVLGVVNADMDDDGVVVCAAGSMPGDLHKLWQVAQPGGYHVEYGYSCMGYEIAGGLGVKLAAPDRQVVVLVGDGSYLMMNSEIVTAVQEGLALTIVLVDNAGFASIGALSRSVGSDGFGTLYRARHDGSLGLDSEVPDGHLLPVDLGANAAGLGAEVRVAASLDDLRDALTAARRSTRPFVIHVKTDRYAAVPGYESWWDVPVAAVSDDAAVDAARGAHRDAQRRQRPLIG
jgi:3D-(3,5/4)-trihydroxycyclohexane-1,2-dione acylhydrolase (decyclizing)